MTALPAPYLTIEIMIEIFRVEPLLSWPLSPGPSPLAPLPWSLITGKSQRIFSAENTEPRPGRRPAPRPATDSPR